MSSLYVHIPFCQSRCIYCDFYSTTLGLDVMKRYVEALKYELSLRRHYILCSRVHTIYIGGGTPSLLPPELLEGLFRAIGESFSIAEDAEVTIEANPDDVTEQWLESVKRTPVNRISMGAQTFDEGLLRFLGRRHDSRQTEIAIERCKKAGIGNISIDLIYGLPHQSMQMWTDDVNHALSLGIQHLSAYALSFEDGTRLDAMLRQGLVEEADEELSWQMYEFLMTRTRQAGFQHYEISNFALPGFHSRHNSVYWQGTPYLGIGAGAHSYDGLRTRRANRPDIDSYIKAYINALEDVPHETEQLNDDMLYDEFVMTRLRTSAGIPLNQLTPEDREYCLNMAKPHLSGGLLHIENNHLLLSQKGIFTSNDIISDLMK